MKPEAPSRAIGVLGQGPRSAGAAGLRRRRVRLNRKSVTGYLFVLPLVAALLVFDIYPIIQSFHISFLNDNGVSGRYVGLSNYTDVLTDPQFWSAFYNTVYMGVLGVVFGIPISFICASLIHALPVGKGFFKAVYFAPNVTSTVALAIVFTYLFYPTDHGLVNIPLGWLHIGPLGWFSDPRFARLGIVIMDLWHGIGYSMLIWLAGLQSVPRELYEAAAVDGANGLRKWWYITIPSIKPIFFFVVVMGTIGAFKRFTDVFVIGGADGAPGGVLSTLMVYIYRYAFTSFEFGRASAASFITFAFIILVTLLNFRLFRERRV